MKRLNSILFFLFVFIVCFNNAAYCFDPTGAWKIEYDDLPEFAKNELGHFFYIEQYGPKIVLLNGMKSQIGVGTFTAKTIEAKMSLGSENFILTGSMLENEIKGTVLLYNSNDNFFLRAIKFESFWQCGNHKPAHCAQNMTEIHECTNKYECENWRKAN